MKRTSAEQWQIIVTHFVEQGHDVHPIMGGLMVRAPMLETMRTLVDLGDREGLEILEGLTVSASPVQSTQILFADMNILSQD